MENKKKYPFKDLAAYERKDKPFYFGRETKAKELYQMTFESNLILLYGASGVGKSSLIGCGLANKFEEYEWLDISVRRSGNKINKSLTDTLNNKIGNNCNEEKIEEQIRLLRRKYFKPIYLIFDQFEELYISGNDDEQKDFYATIRKILEQNQPIKIIISIREEYLGYLYEFERAVPQLFSHKCWVKPLMLGENNEQNIILELLQGVDSKKDESNVHIHDCDDLAEEINKLFKDENKEKTIIDLPSLQILFHELYLYLSEDKDFDSQNVTVFSVKALQRFCDEKKITNIKDILWNYLNRLVSDCCCRDVARNVSTAMVWTVLLELVTEQGTKKTLCETELKKKFAETDICTITDFFKGKEADKRNNILAQINQNEDCYWELRHDALAKCILDKLSDEIKLKKIITQRTKDKETIKTFQLKELEKCKDKLYLDKKEERWVRTSKIRNNLKPILIGLAFVAVILVGVIFYQQWQKTEIAKEEAQQAYSKAEKLIDAFYFYDGKFALAYKDNLFYFIDKEGDPVDTLGEWKQAEQFDKYKAFAKVIDNSGYTYVLDTAGTRYIYSNDINTNEPKKIEILDLSKQNLLILPSERISMFINLTELNLSDNNLKNLPLEIWDLSKLTKLDLSQDFWNESQNNTDSLPAKIKNLTNLTYLNLSGNKLDRLPPEIGELKKLTYLDLSRTKITSLPPEIGKLVNLTHLGLSEIKLDSLPPEIGELKNLTYLDLGGTPLSSLPPKIWNLTNLTFLKLFGKENCLTSGIGNLTNLTHLDLSYKINNFPPEIGNLTKLTWLSLYGDSIVHLPEEMRNLKIENLFYNGQFFDSISQSIILEMQGIVINNRQKLINSKVIKKQTIKNQKTIKERTKINDNGKKYNQQVTYDKYGNIIETVFFRNKKLVVVKKYGFAKKTSKYDKYGNQIEGTFLGVDEELIFVEEQGCAKFKYKYDKYGNQIEGVWFDTDGKLIFNEQYGCAKFKLKYDKYGNQIEGAKFDADGKLIFDKNSGCARYKRKYDKYGNQTFYATYDEYGKLCKREPHIPKKIWRVFNKNKEVIAYLAVYDDEDGDEIERLGLGSWSWNIFTLCMSLALIVICLITEGFNFHRKKRRLYKWLCFGVAIAVGLSVVGAYVYLLLA